MNRNSSPGAFSFEGSSPLAKNIESQFSLCKEFESFEQSSPKFARSLSQQSDNTQYLQNIKNPVQCIYFSEIQQQDKENISDNQFKEEQKLQEGMKKFKELGQTIKESINQINSKFSETKNAISTITKSTDSANIWDQKLDQFYEQLFNQAKQALFQNQNQNAVESQQQQPSKQAPAKTNNQILNKKKPISCQKFTNDSIQKTFNFKNNNGNNRNNVLGGHNNHFNNTKVFSTQKFQIPQQKPQISKVVDKQKPQSVGKFSVGHIQQKKIFKPDPISKFSKNIKKEIIPPIINQKNKLQIPQNNKKN